MTSTVDHTFNDDLLANEADRDKVREGSKMSSITPN